MNRFTVVLIGVLLLTLIGVIAYFNRQLKQLNEEKIEILQQDIIEIRNDQQEKIDMDSIVSMLEAKAIARGDSIVAVLDWRMMRLRNEYKTKLKKQDERIAASLDSIGSLTPSLPNF